MRLVPSAPVSEATPPEATPPPKVETNLRRPRASKITEIAIGSTPSGATVKLDRVEIGKTPLRKRVKPGAHQLVVFDQYRGDQTADLRRIRIGEKRGVECRHRPQHRDRMPAQQRRDAVRRWPARRFLHGRFLPRKAGSRWRRTGAATGC